MNNNKRYRKVDFILSDNSTGRITVSEIAYLVYFSVMLSAKAIGLYEGQFLYNAFLIVGAVMFALKMVLTKYSLLEYFAAFLLLALGAVVYLKSGEKSLLIFITMMLGMKGVSERRVFKFGAYIWVTAFVAMYVLSVIGVIPETAYILDRADWPPIFRHTLGYPHPNTLHVTYFVLCIFVLYSCKNLSRKWNVAIAALLMIGNCYVFMYSLSRNGFFVATLYLLIHFFFLYKSDFGRVTNVLLRLIFPICATSMLILPIVINGDRFEFLNTKLAGRLEYSRYFLTYKPLELFGIREIPVPRPGYYIDSSYVYLIFRLGIVAYILYFVAVNLLINKLLKEKKYAELSVVLALSIGGIIETYLFNQSYKNYIFVFLGVELYKILCQSSKKIPGFISEEKIGLTIGERTIGRSKDEGKSKRRFPINILVFAAFLAVLAGVLTSIVYVCVTKTPSVIYVPINEVTTGDWELVYLSDADVKEIKARGDMIRGYVDEKTPLFVMEGYGIAKTEYIRNIFSYGLWGGSVAAIAFLLIWTTRNGVRLLLRNRVIGGDYKENVLLVHNYYRIPGGEDVVVANEKALLEAHGHKVVLYSRNNDEVQDGSLIKKIGLVFVTIFNVRTYREVCALIEKEKIDVIHVHNTVALVSPAVYIAGINRGIPVVQTIHNFRLVCPNGVCYIKDHVCERCLEHGLRASLLYNCYRNSKLQTFVCAMTMKIHRTLLTYRELNYICLTEFNKKKLLTIKQIREKNIYIKPNFTTMEIDVVPYKDRKFQMVYAGRLEKIKGVDLLLQAWMKLGDKAPKLVICGSGELQDWCSEYIANNEIENVEMRGQIPNSEVKKLIGESMAMLYPTQWYEGFPMAVAEAYTMGTPIIASDIGNVGNLVADGVSGLKFKSNSVKAMVNAVNSFMESPVALPEEYLTMYTAENNYKMLKEIYEDVRRKALL